ncbi:stromal interaction molecule 2-like isoform X3 [Ptychodera flava]|uniref:stromal interaction molecule 2-like isoform X3 n=1 Tax=Ptychodera flava TaxID=63121 RepID=UPI00396A5FD3
MLRNYCRIHSMNLSSVLCGVVIVVAVWPWSSIASAGQSVEKPRLPRGSSTALAVPVDTCIKESCEKVDDKDIQGWDAIRMLHRQLDDDANGNVDPSESDEFLRDELKYEDNFDRHNTFHGDDNFISVDDLWSAWKNSEVYNWTVEETLDWLVNSVELPQYRDTFQNNAVDGAMLPRLAVNSQFLVTILGIKDPVHKQKIMVKAMDVVLFGAPKPSHNYVKDTALVMSLVIAVGGCWFAYIQHRYSQSHMKQMLKDMENLQKAEESLSELQEKLQQAHQQKKSVLEEKESLEEKMRDEVMAAKAEAERLHLARDNTDTELNRLRLAEEELEQVRRALRKAEYELECRSAWSAPPVLQQWLQVTHEIELMYYGMKKQAAEKQLASAKEGCEKLRKKRSTFMGSFRIAHGSSLDEVDHRIVSAKSALAEVTSDLQERLHRWGQIEQIIGLPIVNNPGLSYLTQILQTDTGSAAATPISMPSTKKAASHKPLPVRSNTEQAIRTKPIKSILKYARSSSAGDLLEYGKKASAKKETPARSKTEQPIKTKSTKSFMKHSRSSSASDLLDYGNKKATPTKSAPVSGKTEQTNKSKSKKSILKHSRSSSASKLLDYEAGGQSSGDGPAALPTESSQTQTIGQTQTIDQTKTSNQTDDNGDKQNTSAEAAPYNGKTEQPVTAKFILKRPRSSSASDILNNGTKETIAKPAPPGDKTEQPVKTKSTKSLMKHSRSSSASDLLTHGDKKTSAAEPAPVDDKTEKPVSTKPTKSILKRPRSSSAGDILDNGSKASPSSDATQSIKSKRTVQFGCSLYSGGKSSSEADLSKLGRPYNKLIIHSRITNSTDQLFHGSPSSPLISANLTPMELNPHISIADCDEDLPPTYSMVTDASNQPPRYGSMKRIQPLRNVQSASCIATMPFASTSTGTAHSEIITSRPAPGKSNTMLNPNITSSQATPSTSTSQVSTEKITSQPASTSGTHQTSQIKTADSPSADPGAISRQDKPISGNDEKTSNIKEEKKASSQDSLKRSKSAGDQKQSSKNPSKATKEQVKMSQSAGALMVSQDVKKIANSMFWVKMSQTVPDGKLMKKVRRPNSLALSQSEKNLSTMTSANVENNNAATLPSTAKKKSGWFKKHSSPTSTVQAESNEAGDSSDSFDCDDKKKKKKKKISFGKGSDKHKPTWYLQQ